VPSLGLHHPEILSLRVATFKGGRSTPTPSRDWYEVHHILLAKDAEIVVVESLANLDRAPDAITFIGFPLNFAGRDGSPIRAVAVV
jgi:arylformamidase